MKIKTAVIMSLLAVMLASCGGSAFYEIKDGNIIGCIKDYSKNDDVSRMKVTALKRIMPELEGDAVFVDLKILGEADGKTYTQNTYAVYERTDGAEIERIETIDEFAAFASPDDSDFEAVTGTQAWLHKDEFLPESISSRDSTEVFDMYVYSIGKANEELDRYAAEYFAE
ncbi:MAG: hypothetical protein ACI38A_10280 [Candidatus Ornithomonoglobus sp.]